MDTVQILGSAMGLGLLAGVRLYATVFALGLAIRAGWFQLAPEFSHLSVLAGTPVLVASGLAFATEFLADKVPWLDSVWDSVHTFIRPIGAAVLGATALGNFDPSAQVVIGLLCGGIAFTGHASKAATRLIANHSPEPFTNVALSIAEDIAVPAGLWVVFQHPEIALAIVVAFLLLFAWLSPKLFRLMTVSWSALKALMKRMLPAEPSAAPAYIAGQADPAILSVMKRIALRQLPDSYVRKLGGQPAWGIHCAATASVRGMNNSTGYLCGTAEDLIFTAPRLFRLRVNRWPWKNLSSAELRRGLFLDSLALKSEGHIVSFDVFKTRRPQPSPQSSRER